MGDRMTPLSFAQLLHWVLEEKKTGGTVFSLHEPYVINREPMFTLFGEKLEMPFGPAAGPHTQLAQNLIAAYYAGSRFFELKTVQKLDGEDLPVSKPCIKADDEGYNVEWSTELTVPQAFEEYVKAWFLMHLMAKEFGLGAADGFIFNMSVGYDLDGIKTKKIDDFIEGLKDASETAIFKECRDYALDHLELFSHVTKEDVGQIPANICRSITLSTLHGCPPQEIERIAAYLLTEKKLHTFIKCNPTLLGYEFARKTLDEMGYDYISFTDFHFKDDLQYEDAVPMLKRLMALAEEQCLRFGVKLTNTFPVDIKAGELPGEEMYMSGRALYPLSISLAARLSEEFDGKLRISYSGGADVHNIGRIVEAGIWPVTVATTILKPGGYARFTQLAYEFGEREYAPFEGVDTALVKKLAQEAKADPHYRKPIKPFENKKMKQKLPLLECFAAPCEAACPIHQDIVAYLHLVEQRDYAEALKVIMEKNPLPFTTGTICSHNCMSRCTRNFYEESVKIRQMKLLAAERGYESVLAGLNGDAVNNKADKIAIVGGGPAGISAAYFLAKAGFRVTMFCQKDEPGGVIRYIIPEFRIKSEVVEKDTAFIKKLGVEFKGNTHISSLDMLKGYRKIILATGAANAGELHLQGDSTVNAVTFLEDFKVSEGKMDIGRRVVVIGGGNTAMDAARAAIRTEGVEKVSLVYRRTKRYMPADEEELLLAMEDGVEFRELLSPERFADGVLRCRVMKLGEPDASGRRSPVETDEEADILADMVIAAIGEKVDSDFYQKLGIDLDEKGLPALNEATLESNIPGVYVIGDGRKGPSTVVEAIADAKKTAEAIIGGAFAKDRKAERPLQELYAKKGYICGANGETDCGRCLDCAELCENCVDVCPNRANVSIKAVNFAMPQILHIDRLCNECGNCEVFCPYTGAPYKDKLTLFATDADFENSGNAGFFFVDSEKPALKVRLNGQLITAEGFTSLKEQGIDEDIAALMQTVYEQYGYLCALRSDNCEGTEQL